MSTPNELVEALAFLYLTFGQATDGSLTQEEMRTLAARLQKRAPDIELAELGQVLRATVTEYKGIGSRQARIDRAQIYAEVLHEVVDEAMRHAILTDLVEIAHADGTVSDEEQAFIDRTAETLGVETKR